MKKIFFILSFILLINSLSKAQMFDKLRRSDYKHHIGLTGGYSMGVGLSYLYQQEKLGVQATYSPFYSKENNFTTISITGLYMLNQGRNINFMLYMANNFVVTDIEDNSNNFLNSTGLGLAYQVYLTQNWKLSLYTGYAYTYYDFSEIHNHTNAFTPDGGMSLYFMF
jgi:hypothetical protein